MRILRLFVHILFLVSLILGGEAVAAQGGGSVTGAKIEREIEHARELLDSWTSQGDILDQAKEILDEVLKREPENYRALKELARYHIMDGYLHSKEKINRQGNIYSVNHFEPGTLERAEGILKRALRINPKYAEGYVLLGHVYTHGPRCFAQPTKDIMKLSNYFWRQEQIRVKRSGARMPPYLQKDAANRNSPP